MPSDNNSRDTGNKNIEHFVNLRANFYNIKPPSYPSRCLHFLSAVKTTDPASAANIGSAPAQSPLSLKILIAGAGLGGLASAVALARRGHKVTIFEQASVLGEVGAGIQIPSNSARLLLRWGLGSHLTGIAVEPESIAIRRWENGDLIGWTQLIPDFRRSFGAPYYVIHRAHLHEALHNLALELGVKVELASTVVDYDLDAPSLTLENGSVHHGDLVIGADGLKSKARVKILGGVDDGPQLAGFAAYRATVNVEMMKNDPDTAWLLTKPGLNLWTGTVFFLRSAACLTFLRTTGDMRHVMTYTIASGKSFNIVLSHPEDTDPSIWRQETAIDDMRQQFAGWDYRLVKIINMIDKTMKWPIMSGTPLRTWVSPSCKCLILGDAAHAMVPYMSQGAAMAVEDGAALGEILSHVTSHEELPSAIKLFEKIRMERSYQMQEASLLNGKLWHFPDGPLQRARDEGMRPEVERKHFIESPNQWSDPVTQHWSYGHDAEEAAREAWMKYKAGL